MPLRRGEALELRVEQRSLDLQIELQAPEGGKILQVDSWSQAWGTEFLCFVAEAEGDYRIQLAPVGLAPLGGFTLRSSVTGAREEHRRCWEAAQATALAYRTALEPRPRAEITEAFERAAQLWRRRRNRYQEALLYQRLASLHQSRGDGAAMVRELERALNLFEGEDAARVEWCQVAAKLAEALFRRGQLEEAQALTDRGLEAALEDDQPAAEAFMRLGLGAVYQIKGEPYAAASELERALEIFRGLGVVRAQTQVLVRQTTLYSEALNLFQEAIDSATLAHSLWAQQGGSTQ
ncbi:MAG: hypothetical protein AAF725_26715, partial [Acidobacteriota bacterium]